MLSILFIQVLEFLKATNEAMQTFSLTNRAVPLEKGKIVPKGGKMSPRGPIGVGSLVGPTPLIDERLCLCVSEAIVEFLGTCVEKSSYVTLCDVMSCLHHILSYHIISHHHVEYHAMPCHVIMWY